MTRIFFAVVLCSSLSACGSYKDDLYKICHAQELSGAPPGSGLAGSAEWLEKHLSTKKSKELLRSIASQGSIDAVRGEFAANGITPCPMFDPAK